jgi:hypothetical protein
MDGRTNAKIHEVIAAMAGDINDLFQHCLINTVGDVAQHDLERVSGSHEIERSRVEPHSSADVLATLNATDVNSIVVGVLIDATAIAKTIILDDMC